MQQASSALHIIIAALLAAAATVITGFILGSWENAVLTAVALSTFLGGLLTPYISSALSSNGSSAKPKATSSTTQASTSASGELRTLYVGNLPFKTDEESVSALFSQYGAVNAVRLVKDRRTGRKKGYGFVEMDAHAVDAALAALNDSEFEGRTIKVRTAHSDTES
ncbi:RNA-binding protein [Aliidiomarina taiwanensis]|uniref:RNA-binding protein n=1 Tax=Aliidiomarina taiwanensis TaxID=946228 RepID=A0A432WYL8_9GAMM|nr:RNA-binding protein [Aliidiomarina taiwanensis]RUO38865.1 RNA-binding protein [Aliidiomarina taiwanensis]